MMPIMVTRANAEPDCFSPVSASGRTTLSVFSGICCMNKPPLFCYSATLNSICQGFWLAQSLYTMYNTCASMCTRSMQNEVFDIECGCEAAVFNAVRTHTEDSVWQAI